MSAAGGGELPAPGWRDPPAPAGRSPRRCVCVCARGAAGAPGGGSLPGTAAGREGARLGWGRQRAGPRLAAGPGASVWSVSLAWLPLAEAGGSARLASAWPARCPWPGSCRQLSSAPRSEAVCGAGPWVVPLRRALPTQGPAVHKFDMPLVKAAFRKGCNPKVGRRNT